MPIPDQSIIEEAELYISAFRGRVAGNICAISAHSAAGHRSPEDYALHLRASENAAQSATAFLGERMEMSSSKPQKVLSSPWRITKI